MMDAVEVEFEDIEPLLNPVQQSTLVEILALTPAHKRAKLAMAFAGINGRTWVTLAGLNPGGKQNTADVQIYRWLTEYATLPLGAAARLSAVFGVPTELLFSEHIRREVEKREVRQTKGKVN
jgi:hypothetical protein